MDTIITPQALGAIIKRTGVTKSASRKGNFYNYNTEGYRLTRQYDGRYTVEYYARLELVRRTDSEQARFYERQEQAFNLIIKALEDKAIPYEFQASTGTLWINIKAEKAVA